MKNYLNITLSLKSFLKNKKWSHKSTLESRVSVWEDSTSEIEVVIPEPELIKHPQSHSYIDEAINKLSEYYDIEKSALTKHLDQGGFDVFKVRASGSAIPSGKINFKDGLASYENLYNLIKYSARKNINVKGKKAIVDDYLAGVNMLAPSQGSFIYSFESSLLKVVKDEKSTSADDLGSVGRYVNIRLAKLIENLFKFANSNENIAAADLIRNKIDFSTCDYFLNLFSEASENIDFEFYWSFEEEVTENIPEKISFTQKHKSNITSYKEILKRSSIVKYTDLPGWIERYAWPRDSDEGRISIKISIDDSEYVCSIPIVDAERYEKLKNEPNRQQVFITADIVKTIGSRMSVGITKLHHIKLSTQEVIIF